MKQVEPYNTGKIATGKNKIPALTEFGYSGLPDPTWWTNVLLKAVQPHHISYMLAWRNAGKNWTARRILYTIKDRLRPATLYYFIKKRTLFESDIAKEIVQVVSVVRLNLYVTHAYVNTCCFGNGTPAGESLSTKCCYEWIAQQAQVSLHHLKFFSSSSLKNSP